jgi:hypothetical protein
MLALSSAGFLGGCSADDSDAETAVASGSLELPLVSSAGGHTYRLNGGYLYVYSYDVGYSTYVDLGGDVPSVSVSLRTGHYRASLNNPGLVRDDGTGNFLPVRADLVSSETVDFDIYDGTTSSIAFEFETDGALVRVGAGSLDVRVEVTEGAAVCTPFANDCGEGSWCPPTELTGRPRECVATGAHAVGDACSGPLDCVADSSCFDFGGGPACAALCPASSVGEACAEGVTCVAAGSDYGVCTPDPAPAPAENN